MMALAWVASITPAVIAVPLEAEARITRNDCYRRGTAANMGRNMGIRNAGRIVQAMWQRLGRTCNQVDRLAMIISETPLARPMQGGEFAACFYQGYVDTLWSELDRIYDSCGTRCFSAGAEIGSISAQGYCAASLALGGLYDPGFISQPPLPFCGQNLVFGCKSEYVAVAQFEYPGCHVFTEGAFALTFENTVRQDCFVPSDVPIRDYGAFTLAPWEVY
jgi:hypothetical protein